MLDFSAAVAARLEGQRGIALARKAYTRQVTGVASASGAVSSSGAVSCDAGGAAPGGDGPGKVTAPADGAPSRHTAAAAFAAALGDAPPPQPPLPPPPTSPPAEPDYAALAAALPPVPPPPAVPAELLHAQECPACGAGYVAPSGSANEHLYAGGGGGGSTGPTPVAPVNVGVLRQTLAAAAEDVPRALAAAGVLPPPTVGAAAASDTAGSDECGDAGIAAALAAVLAGAGAPAAAAPAAAASAGVGGAAPSTTAAPAPFAPPVVALAYDAAMLLHEEVARPAGSAGGLRLALPGVALPPPPRAPHPERPDRTRAIAQHLAATGVFARCVRVPARPATDAELALVHTPAHCAAMAALPAAVAAAAGDLHFGSDTFANSGTAAAARLSCGAVTAVVEAVLAGAAERGIAVVRPPGHHAEPDGAMGFCLYNNVAVAAAVARRSLGARRVLIVDWDVHHGNGTQHMFEDDPTVLYVSLHRHDRGSFYPGTGAGDEVGVGEGIGYTLNIPWAEGGAGDAEYLAAFDEVIMPVAHAFAPDVVLVSAGFDAAEGDPLGGCSITPGGYAHMTQRLLSLAGGRVVVALEGGYNLTSIARSMEAVARVLLGQAPPPLFPVPRRAHEPRPGAVTAGGGARSGRAGGGGDAPPHPPPPPPLPPALREVGSVFAAAVAAGAALDAADAADGGALGGEGREDLLDAFAPSPSAMRVIAEAVRVHARYWPALRVKWRAYVRIADAVAGRGGAAALRGVGAGAGDGDASTSAAVATAAEFGDESGSGGESDDDDDGDDDDEEADGDGAVAGQADGDVTDAGGGGGGGGGRLVSDFEDDGDEGDDASPGAPGITGGEVATSESEADGEDGEGEGARGHADVGGAIDLGGDSQSAGDSESSDGDGGGRRRDHVAAALGRPPAPPARDSDARAGAAGGGAPPGRAAGVMDVTSAAGADDDARPAKRARI